MNVPSLKPLALVAGIALALGACSQKPAETESATTPAAESAAATAEPAHIAFDINELDSAINVCSDLNGFVNAKWVAANPIPADKTRWGTFDVLREASLKTQHEIAEAAANSNAATGSIEQKVGALYKAGMDEAAIDALGAEPLKPELAKIDALKTSADVVAYLGDSFSRGVGSLFYFGAETDFKNSQRKIAYAFQGGLGLPTPDYYQKDEHAKIRDAYLAHIAKVLELAGVDAAAASKQAAAVLAFETALAKESLPPVELRNPENQYHFVSIADADKVTPHFEWGAFFKAQNADVTDGFSLSQPKFFAQMDKMLASTPVADWQAYLRFQYADKVSPYLSAPFQQEHFAFHKQTLNGQKENEPRWKRVLGAVNSELGMALGELYVAKAFPPEAKARAQELVDNVQAALKTHIESLDWMSDATKAKALEKWSTFLPKIGYPEKWRDWSGLSLGDGGFFADVMATTKFNYDYEIAKIGKPTDRKDWGMTPQTVNAYYNPTDNTINFPAAILQPPFFDAKADDALNYGGIGGVIGHEAIHGFDDQGSQFDAQGNNTNWWTDDDRKAFEARTDKLVAQFNAYEPLPGKHVNGQLTLGENIADLGGSAISLDALRAALAKDPAAASQKIDGYTPEQRFFLNWARIWRANMRDQRMEVMLNTDPHSPSQYRAIGAPSNLSAFADAFGCKDGDAMVRDSEKQVKIW
ncbi:MAG: M13 family peptidase [Gammaproteobacteria bacterium]|nr:MAG: M13 family peptidase [Gammaproteobacteria bacterium]